MPDEIGDGWAAIDDGRELIRYADREVRVSISWKAEVFADAEAARVREEHLDDLPLDAVVDGFLADLAARGVEVERPRDPARDDAFIRILNETYPSVVPRS